MSAVKHTPTPWEIQDPMGADIGLWIVEVGKQAYEWRCIALVCQDGDREPGDPRPIKPLEQEANAAFIVKAANCHDDLLEALKVMTQRFAFMAGVNDELKAILVNANAAIGKASAPQALARAAIRALLTTPKDEG